MNTNLVKSVSTERETTAVNGWVMLLVNLALVIGALAWFVLIIVRAVSTSSPSVLWWLITT